MYLNVRRFALAFSLGMALPVASVLAAGGGGGTGGAAGDGTRVTGVGSAAVGGGPAAGRVGGGPPAGQVGGGALGSNHAPSNGAAGTGNPATNAHGITGRSS